MELNHYSPFSVHILKIMEMKKKGFYKKLLTIMKLIAIIMLSVSMTASANGYSQNVTLSVKNASLKNVFTEIRKQTGYEFLYASNLLKKSKSVDVDVKNLNVLNVLDLCFRNQPLSYSIIGKTVVIRPEKPKTLNLEIEAPKT
ncbi:MAG: STN domain-containing protein, partial [Ginsengibacter sp.]